MSDANAFQTLLNDIEEVLTLLYRQRAELMMAQNKTNHPVYNDMLEINSINITRLTLLQNDAKSVTHITADILQDLREGFFIYWFHKNPLQHKEQSHA